jgi:hypothetical protein
MFRQLLALFIFLATCLPLNSLALEITSYKTDQPPLLDGDLTDPAWQAIAVPYVIDDKTADAPIFLKSVHTDDTIYFSVMYKDQAQSPFHKPWLWNQDNDKYEQGAHREDTFVFKWNMMEKEVDLSNFSDDNYTADIWYWKANRTNPAGYADDKRQILSSAPGKKSTVTESAAGKIRYLSRKSDAGKPAYAEMKKPPTELTTQLIDRYPYRLPQGSRGDVHAKGVWNKGFWIVEFSRKLQTGHDDDVQFNLSGKSYLFGVSIFSLYGRPVDKSEPNRYGMGRISEPLYLTFE